MDEVDTACTVGSFAFAEKLLIVLNAMRESHAALPPADEQVTRSLSAAAALHRTIPAVKWSPCSSTPRYEVLKCFETRFKLSLAKIDRVIALVVLFREYVKEALAKKDTDLVCNAAAALMLICTLLNIDVVKRRALRKFLRTSYQRHRGDELRPARDIIPGLSSLFKQSCMKLRPDVS